MKLSKRNIRQTAERWCVKENWKERRKQGIAHVFSGNLQFSVCYKLKQGYGEQLREKII